jgi:dinuclear metal center YbgI/SA1388 family protein
VKLDTRLAAVAEFVRGDRLVDVGSDHASLPIALILDGNVNSAIAADINAGPLETGRKNAKKNNLTEKIGFIKTDGLDNIDLDDVSDISIAGMGGELIADILSRAIFRLNGKNLILQPMTKQEYLFDFLLKNGFRIIDQKTVFDDNKKYEIINAILVKNMQTDIKTIYDALDNLAPFSLAQGYGDNSGLLVGDFSDRKIERIMVTLDITNAVVAEAKAKKCDLIVSHHPIIYTPLKNLSNKNPAVAASNAGISCICCHISFDASKTGMNNAFIKLFQDFFEIDHVFNKRFIEDFKDNNGVGIVFELPRNMNIKSRDFAEKLKSMFGAGVVRYTSGNENLNIKKIAFCSGAGGEFLTEIIEKKRADVYISSDLKHSHFIEAQNQNFPLFDCGHFSTEAIMKNFVADYLQNRFTECEILISESDKEPFEVV